MPTPVRVLGVSGSLRKGSWNSGLLRAASHMLPEGMTLEIFDLTPIPVYNQDEESQPPEAVRQLKEKIAAADALLIATPEYNYSIPGVLKNAIDWVSRPPGTSPFNDKPLGIMGAGMRFGTVRAQLHLRQIAVFLNMHPMSKPELLIPMGTEHFDADGNFKTEVFQPMLCDFLVALGDWTRRLRGH